MPDFEVLVTGAAVEPWSDPAGSALPSRLNPREGRSMRRLVGTVGTAITLTAVVGGVTGPADATLGGRLFVCASAEAPHPWTVSFTILTAGWSSVQSFTPSLAGHYLVYMRRPEGGCWFIHIDARDP